MTLALVFVRFQSRYRGGLRGFLCTFFWHVIREAGLARW